MADRPYQQSYRGLLDHEFAHMCAGGEFMVNCVQIPATLRFFMESFIISTGVVTLSEIGDKTQLLAFILAARFKKPLPIILGILVATLLNHGLAGALGAWIMSQVTPNTLKWILGVLFLVMAAWTLIPDKMDDDDSTAKKLGKFGVFGTTMVTFFLAEMGDKTQLTTVMLAAHYTPVIAVIAGTTLGMLIADVPAVFVGNKLADRIPMKWVRWTAALVFAVLGLIILMGDSFTNAMSQAV